MKTIYRYTKTKIQKKCYKISKYVNEKQVQKHSKWYDLKKEAKEMEKEYLKFLNENNSSDEEISFKDVWESYNTILNKGIHCESLYNIKMINFDIKFLITGRSI